MIQSLIPIACVLSIFITKSIHSKFLNMQLIINKASVQLTQLHIESDLDYHDTAESFNP